MLAAIHTELQLRQDYLQGQPVKTIYFGGGTPSMLTAQEVEAIIDQIGKHYPLHHVQEVTLEGNPDDLTYKKLQALKQAGINRLSIGIQSFNEQALQFMNRAHNARESLQCIEAAQRAGFTNYNLDLIYAIPVLDEAAWVHDVATLLAAQPKHISAYCLTIEEGTAFGHWLKQGRLTPIDENLAADQLQYLNQRLGDAGFEHYEVSNYAQPGALSKHNSSYWQQQPYLGLGPSAHSYNGKTRQYAVRHNAKYINMLAAGTLPLTEEVLTPTERANELLLTGLRTKWGCSLKDVQGLTGIDLSHAHSNYLNGLVNAGYATLANRHLTLTEQGLSLADEITAQLFIEH